MQPADASQCKRVYARVTSPARCTALTSPWSLPSQPPVGLTHLRPAAAAAKTASSPSLGRRTSLSPSPERARAAVEERAGLGGGVRRSAGSPHASPGSADTAGALRPGATPRCGLGAAVRCCVPGSSCRPALAAPGQQSGAGQDAEGGAVGGAGPGGAGVCKGGAGPQVLREARWGGTRLLRELQFPSWRRAGWSWVLLGCGAGVGRL